MQGEVFSVNRACLQAAHKLCSCDEKWQRCMQREFGMSEKDMEKICILDRETVRMKAQNPTVLYKVRQDRMRNAVAGLERGADYYNAKHPLSNEMSMAVSVFVSSLVKCLSEDINEACVRFGISPDMAHVLVKHGTDEIIDAMLANYVTFEPARSFRAVFQASNNLERTRYMLQDMHSFLRDNNVLAMA